MKLYRSKFFKSVAIFYLGFPLFYLPISALLFDVPAGSLVGVLLWPSYFFISILAITVGYALWQMHRWGWYLFIVTNFLITYLNAIVLNEYGTTHHQILSFLASFFGLSVVTYRVAQEIRVPYFFPKIRWWESNPRYKLSIPVKISPMDAPVIDGDILDISMVGCFIKTKKEIYQDQKVRLQFVIFKLSFECSGVIAWRAKESVTIPKGMGVKFLPLRRPQKRTLRQICRRLKQISDFYRRSRYLLSHEEFCKRLKELESEILQSSSSSRKRLLR